MGHADRNGETACGIDPVKGTLVGEIVAETHRSSAMEGRLFHESTNRRRLTCLSRTQLDYAPAALHGKRWAEGDGEM